MPIVNPVHNVNTPSPKVADERRTNPWQTVQTTTTIIPNAFQKIKKTDISAKSSKKQNTQKKSDTTCSKRGFHLEDQSCVENKKSCSVYIESTSNCVECKLNAYWVESDETTGNYC